MNALLISFNILIEQLLPVRLRTAAHTAWLKVLVVPLTTLHAKFMVARTQNLLFATTTSQVVSLERLLNGMYDASLRRIYITDPQAKDYAYVYPNNHPQALYIYPNNNGASAFVFDGNSSPWHFVVNIPAAAAINVVELRALLDKFRLPSKTYLILTF